MSSSRFAHRGLDGVPAECTDWGVSTKAPFLEMKIRAANPQQKADFEKAAREARPVALSLQQWLLTAAVEKLERDRVKEK